ncbi:MAG: hypothetical protein PHQ66_00575 [Candidatus Nanoarchaeia archaeon]|nr:hypothetical protein [Candidatus Nanoarchaeia archaeon]MDD5358059.1 hypothetical protein [Candidatus Nanoarchaeia archaeon]MDD5589247.1 hypothetical protein [Candidatus Nanoarchaeia archaeon]
MKKLILFFAVLFLISFVCAEVQYPIAELGNCADESACKIYCDDVNNMETCLDVAEETGLMTDAEVEEARMFLPFLLSGETPGGCGTPDDCDLYCDNEANINECVDFALKAGIIDAEEAEMVKRTGGKGPGGCQGAVECDNYCEDESHITECVDFALQYGMISAEEAEMVKRTGGKGPGGCQGKEECDSFCQDKANFETCIDFSVQNGFMSAEEAEMVKKSGGESPGGCGNKEECDAFCSSEEGREVCLEFSYEHGMISEEEYNKIKEGGGQGMWAGPGGCTSEEECQAYCESGEHMQECMDFSLANGFMSQEEYDQQMADWQRYQEEGAPTGDENAPGGEPGSYEPGEESGVPGGEGIPGEAPGGEAGDYEVPPTEAPTGEGGETPEEVYVPPVEVPAGEVGSGGEAPVTGEVIARQKQTGNGLINFIKNLFN